MKCVPFKSSLALLLIAACPAIAAQARSGPELPTVIAIRADGPVKIDGKLDEPFWSKAPVQSDFHELLRRGSRGTNEDPTEFRIAFDGQAILLGITCHQKHMDQLVAKVTEPDGPVWSDDSIEVFLRYNDQHYYHFSVNSRGTRGDMREPIKGNLDRAEAAATVLWDGVWKAATQKQADRWTVELRIPLATLDIGPTPPSQWRLNVARHFARAKSNFSWAPVQRGFSDPALQGFLKGITVEPGQFPLTTAEFTFPPFFVGENHVPIKFPAARAGPYQFRALVQSMEEGGRPESIADESLTATNGELSADLTIPVKKADVDQRLTLDIADAKSHQPVFLQSYVFRAPQPLEASTDWAVYYDTDPSVGISAHLAVTPSLAKGQLVAAVFAASSTAHSSIATHAVAIRAPGDLHMDFPLADIPPGTYRLEVTADLPQLGQFKKEFWFHRVPAPFAKN